VENISPGPGKLAQATRFTPTSQTMILATRTLKKQTRRPTPVGVSLEEMERN
jgi:hypothetical protein